MACAFAEFAGPAAPASSIFPREVEPFPWPDGKAIGARLTWTGVAGFVLEAGGTRIAFDPFVTRPGLFATVFRRAHPDDALVASWFSGLDAVFVGHAHYDHAMDLPGVVRASPRVRIHGSRTLIDLCRRLGIPDHHLVEASDGAEFPVGPLRVAAVASAHGVVPVAGWFDRIELPQGGVPPRAPLRYPRGQVLAWRVEGLARTFHVQGSAGIDDFALRRQRPCDVLIACLAARKGTPGYLDRLGQRLRPSVLIPCHHDDFFRPLSESARPVATLRWDSFLAESARLRAAHGTRTFLPPRGTAVGI